MVREVAVTVSQVDDDTGVLDVILDMLESRAEASATPALVVEGDRIERRILNRVTDLGIGIDDHNLLKVELITRLLDNTRDATHGLVVHRTGGITDKHQGAVPFILYTSYTYVVHGEELTVGSGSTVSNTELGDILAKDLVEAEGSFVEVLQLFLEVPT